MLLATFNNLFLIVLSVLVTLVGEVLPVIHVLET